MIRWTQNSSSYERTVTSTVTDVISMKEIVENQVANAISSSVETKNAEKFSVSATANLEAFDIVKGSLTTAMDISRENLWKTSTSYESKYKTSYEQVSSRTTTETINEKIKFDSSCPTGYYGWNLCGNVKIYAFVIYNDLSQIINIQYITDIVSSTWCFDYLTDEEYDSLTLNNNFNEYIDFELPEIFKPEKYFDIDKVYENYGKNMVTVSFDANGGYCNKEIIVAEGSSYGELPIPTYNNEHYFSGWYDEFGNKIDSDTICTFGENHTLKAKWGKTIYTNTFSAFNVKEATVHFPQLGFKAVDKSFVLNIDKDQLIANGYTNYKVTVELVASGSNAYDLPNPLSVTFFFSDVYYGEEKIATPAKGNHFVKTYTSYSKDGKNKSFLTSEFLNDPTILLRFENSNLSTLDLFKDYHARVSGLTVTITFYKPEEVK